MVCGTPGALAVLASVQYGADDDDLAERQAVHLPGVASGSPDPQPARCCPPPSAAMDRRSRWHDQCLSSRWLAQGDGSGMAKASGSDDERALVGGHAEPHRFEPEPWWPVGWVDEVSDTTPQVATARDPDPDQPVPERD